MTHLEKLKTFKCGIYRHNKKGALYRVLNVSLHTETDELLVLYEAVGVDYPHLIEKYGIIPSFVRPYDMFFEQVELNGELKPRFEYIGESV